MKFIIRKNENPNLWMWGITSFIYNDTTKRTWALHFGKRALVYLPS